MQLLNACTQLQNSDFQGKSAFWVDPDIAPMGKTEIVSTQPLIDGSTPPPFVRGSGTMVTAGQYQGARSPYDMSGLWANPQENWDFRGNELLKLSFYTNDNSKRIDISVLCSSWTGVAQVSLEPNTYPAREWFTIIIDLRMLGASPDLLAQGHAVEFVVEGIGVQADTYFILTQNWTVEPPVGGIPLDVVLLPATLVVQQYNSATFATQAWGGQPPYNVKWSLNGVLTRTDQTSDTVSLAINFTVLGNNILTSEVTDAIGAVVTKTASISVKAPPPLPIPCRPLHCEGGKIVDDTGKPVHLVGLFNQVDRIIDKNNCSIHYIGNQDWVTEQQYWIDELDGMRSWGANSLALYVQGCDSWVKGTLPNFGTINFRDRYEFIVHEAYLRGIYVHWVQNSIFSYGNPPSGATASGFPITTDTPNADEIAWLGWTSKQDYINYCADVCTQLNYPNFIFEAWSEPVGDDAALERYLDMNQQIINAIRARGFHGLLYIMWGYANRWSYDYNQGEVMNWVFDHPITDPDNNIVYGTHVYREYGVPGNWQPTGQWASRQGPVNKEDQRYALEKLRILEILQSHPFLIGEMGVVDSPGAEQLPGRTIADPTVIPGPIAEQMWWESWLDLLNELGIHYNCMSFGPQGILRGLLQPNMPNYQPTAPWGQIAMDAMLVAPPPPPPGKGTLFCKATMNSQQVVVDVEVVGIGTFQTPFTVELDVGTYSLKGAYKGQTVEVSVDIAEGQISEVTFKFVSPAPTIPSWLLPATALSLIAFGAILVVKKKE